MHSRNLLFYTAALNHCKLLICDMSGMPLLENPREQRGVRQEAGEKVERGSVKQDMHKIQTDLIVPRTVQLTEQTPVVANHTVQKMRHGFLHWSNLRSMCPVDTLQAPTHCEANPKQRGGCGETSSAGKDCRLHPHLHLHTWQASHML